VAGANWQACEVLIVDEVKREGGQEGGRGGSFEETGEQEQSGGGELANV